MGDGISNYLFTQGVLGFVLLVLGLAFIFYYKTTQKQLADLNKTIFDLQEARRMDYKESIKEVTDVLDSNSQNLRILSEKIEIGKSIERDR